MPAGECTTRQGKTSKNEIKESGGLFLKYSNAKLYKCKRRITMHFQILIKFRELDKAKDAYQKTKSILSAPIQVTRPIMTIHDSDAISMKLKTCVEKLGYSGIHVFKNGKNGLKGCKEIISKTKNL